MKVLHLISGGDTGGAKTHVHSLLAGLTPRIQVKMVCFTEGPFVEEARALGPRWSGPRALTSSTATAPAAT